MKTLGYSVVLILLMSCSGNDVLVNEDNLKNVPISEELKKVLDHFELCGNELKIQASRFLINHIDGLGYLQYTYFQPTVGEIKDKNEFQDPKNLLYKIKYETDLNAVNAEYLIDNIELAFDSWSMVNWKDSISFSDFCEYILPHRVGMEPLKNWRRQVRLKVDSMFDTSMISLGLRPFTKILNDSLRSSFKFKIHRDKSDQALSFEQLVRRGSGSCEAFVNLNAFVLRSYAVPIMIDFVPVWGNSNGGHSWNSLFLNGSLKVLTWENGLEMAEIMFTSGQNENRLPAKIYRKTYSVQPSLLAKIKLPKEEVPPFFNNDRIIDVTAEYINTVDINHSIIDSIALYGQKYAYLCVYNGGKWVGIDWSHISKVKKLNFRKVGLGNVYIICIYLKGKYQSISWPFHVNMDGNIKVLQPIRNKLENIIVLQTTKESFFAQNAHKIIIGNRYNLHYWNKMKWEKIQSVKATEEKLNFHDVPKNVLLKVSKNNTSLNERIFVYQDGKQVWL